MFLISKLGVRLVEIIHNEPQKEKRTKSMRTEHETCVPCRVPQETEGYLGTRRDFLKSEKTSAQLQEVQLTLVRTNTKNTESKSES